MFDIGIQELILIFIVALIVFGPKRLPDIARAIGKGLAEIRNAMEGVKTQIDSEMREVKELKDMADPIAFKNKLFNGESLIKPYEEPPKPDETKPADTPVAAKEESALVKKAAARQKKSAKQVKKTAPKRKKSGGADKAKKSSSRGKTSGTRKVKRK
jgi:sec-independent protein translocase protein TatB